MENITKRQKALNHFIETLKAKQEDFLNHIIFTYKKELVPIVAIFGEKGFKAESHYRFKNQEQADDFIKKEKASIQRKFDQYQIQLNQWGELKKGYEKGKILVSSWGYEQTNVDFYLILEKKNDFVLIQEIGQNKNYGLHDDRGTTMPDQNKKIGEPFRKKISKYGSIALASYKYCNLWDGKEEHFSNYA